MQPSSLYSDLGNRFIQSDIVIGAAPQLQDLTRISKAITRSSRICSEGIEAFDDHFQIFLFFVQRPRAAPAWGG